MSVKKLILEVGFDKNGQAEFGVTGYTMSLTSDQMKEIRAMIPVAIAQFENMWMRERERTHQEYQATQENGATK